MSTRVLNILRNADTLRQRHEKLNDTAPRDNNSKRKTKNNFAGHGVKKFKRKQESLVILNLQVEQKSWWDGFDCSHPLLMVRSSKKRSPTGIGNLIYIDISFPFTISAIIALNSWVLAENLVTKKVLNYLIGPEVQSLSTWN